MMSHWFGIRFHATSAFRVFIFTLLMVSIDFLFVYVKVVRVKDASSPPNLPLETRQCVVIAESTNWCEGWCERNNNCERTYLV